MYSFKLPDIGEGVNEGEIVKWHVKEGDHISRDQDMVEVMTDKVTVKVPSPVEGDVTRIYHEEGAMVEVGTVLIDIRSAGEAEEPEPEPVPEAAPTERETAEEESTPEEEPVPAPSGGLVLASPAVRRIARERGMDISRLRGSGPNGRVTLDDLESPEPAPSVTESQEPPKVETGKERIEEIEAKMEAAPSQPVREEVLVPKGLRRLIFEKMTKSKQIIPHFTIFEEINIGPIRESVDKLKKENLSVTFTPFFVKAATIALRDFPYMNATYDEENRRYLLKKYYNMGVAIDTPDGLTVAVVKDVDRKSVVALSSEISDLAKRARENALKLEEVQDSTFTVTNVGSIAGIMSTPIINYPEVAILGVHRTLTEIGENGSRREKMYISLSCDHRLVDGAVAARFMKRLRGLLEDPVLILSQ